MECICELPAKNTAAEEIHDDGQIEPTLLGGDVGDVADQMSAGRFGNGGLGQPVGGRMGGMIRTGRFGAIRASWTGP